MYVNGDALTFNPFIIQRVIIVVISWRWKTNFYINI